MMDVSSSAQSASKLPLLEDTRKRFEYVTDSISEHSESMTQISDAGGAASALGFWGLWGS